MLVASIPNDTRSFPGMGARPVLGESICEDTNSCGVNLEFHFDKWVL